VLIVVCALLGLLSPLLFGGDLRNFGSIRLRAVWLPFVALLVQIVIISIIPGDKGWLLSTIHLATYVAAGVFIWLNRSVPGLVLIGLGAMSNGVTIALNGGTLPATSAAVSSAGIAPQPSDFVNSGVLPHPVLPWLGDVFAWPAPMPFANTFSVGDVLIVAGVTYGSHVISRSRLARREPQETTTAAA
jgi:hypothetical protein